MRCNYGETYERRDVIGRQLDAGQLLNPRHNECCHERDEHSVTLRSHGYPYGDQLSPGGE